MALLHYKPCCRVWKQPLSIFNISIITCKAKFLAEVQKRQRPGAKSKFNEIFAFNGGRFRQSAPKKYVLCPSLTKFSKLHRVPFDANC